MYNRTDISILISTEVDKTAAVKVLMIVEVISYKVLKVNYAKTMPEMTKELKIDLWSNRLIE